MKTLKLVSPLIIILLLLPGCASDPVSPDTAEIEAMIKAIIAADDSSYGLDGLGDLDDETFGFSKEITGGYAAIDVPQVLVRDSLYIWRFGKSNMAKERSVVVEVENDSSALALISYHITGSFHARQFERVWSSDSSWARGDSVRFSQKPIDLTVDRRVTFRLRTDPEGGEHWRPSAMSLAYGASHPEMEISRLVWTVGDTLFLFSDFVNTLYPNRFPVRLFGDSEVMLSVLVNNEISGEAEAVKGHWGFHPRQDDLVNRGHFRYMGTADTGEKKYSRWITVPDRPNRVFRGTIEVLDQRTLFDHDFTEYRAATLGFNYGVRRR